MKKYIGILILIVILMTGCQYGDTAKKTMINDIKSIEANEVLLSEVTSMDWEKMYSFGPYASKEHIVETLGFDAEVGETVNEGMTHVIFVKEQQIVCELLGYPSNLDVSIRTYSQELTAKNAYFLVEKKNGITFLKEKTTDLTEEQLWQKIANKEWSTFEKGGLGFGIYLYDKNGKRTALTMIYGSGLPVIHTHESTVKMIGNELHFEFPNGWLLGPESDKKQVAGIALHYVDEKLYFGQAELKEIFPYNEEYNHYDEYIEK